MRIGSNLLKMAQRVIPPQTVSYMRYTGKTTNAAFLNVSQFADPTPLQGNFQPVPRSSYTAMGLDFNKSYCKFYVSFAVQDLQRDIAGDQFIFGGITYQVMSNTDWTNIDGWLGSMAVAITP